METTQANPASWEAAPGLRTVSKQDANMAKAWRKPVPLRNLSNHKLWYYVNDRRVERELTINAKSNYSPWLSLF